MGQRDLVFKSQRCWGADCRLAIMSWKGVASSRQGPDFHQMSPQYPMVCRLRHTRGPLTVDISPTPLHQHQIGPRGMAPLQSHSLKSTSEQTNGRWRSKMLFWAEPTLQRHDSAPLAQCNRRTNMPSCSTDSRNDGQIGSLCLDNACPEGHGAGEGFRFWCGFGLNTHDKPFRWLQRIGHLCSTVECASRQTIGTLKPPRGLCLSGISGVHRGVLGLDSQDTTYSIVCIPEMRPQPRAGSPWCSRRWVRRAGPSSAGTIPAVPRE